MERLTERTKDGKIHLKDLDLGLMKLSEFEDFMQEENFGDIVDLQTRLHHYKFSCEYVEKMHTMWNKLKDILNAMSGENHWALVENIVDTMNTIWEEENEQN